MEVLFFHYGNTDIHVTHVISTYIYRSAFDRSQSNQLSNKIQLLAFCDKQLVNDASLSRDCVDATLHSTEYPFPDLPKHVESRWRAFCGVRYCARRRSCKKISTVRVTLENNKNYCYASMRSVPLMRSLFFFHKEVQSKTSSLPVLTSSRDSRPCKFFLYLLFNLYLDQDCV